jgi:O-antigen/teichoic acid export membrane protein
MNLWYSRKFVDWKKRYQYEYCKHLKPIFLIFGTSIASNIYMTMDTTMLGAMRGDTATGIYTAARVLSYDTQGHAENVFSDYPERGKLV